MRRVYIIAHTYRVNADSVEEAAEKIVRFEQDNAFRKECELKEKNTRFGRPEVTLQIEALEEFVVIHADEYDQET